MSIDSGIILENKMKNVIQLKINCISGTLNSAGSCPCVYNRTEGKITTECATQNWDLLGTEKKKCRFTREKNALILFMPQKYS